MLSLIEVKIHVGTFLVFKVISMRKILQILILADVRGFYCFYDTKAKCLVVIEEGS